MSRYIRVALAITLLSLLGSAILAVPLTSAAPQYVTAYAIRSNVDDVLYRIDLATGAATPVGTGVGFGDVEGLAVDPNGVIYGVDDITDQLVTCTHITGACAAIGALNISTQDAFLDAGLAFDSAGNLWMATHESVTVNQVTGPGFYQINPTTGQGTLIGPLGQEVVGLTASGTTIYGLGGRNTNNLVTIDTATGATSEVGPLTNVRVRDYGGIDFDPSGTLYGINDFTSATDASSRLFTIDPTTGTATVVATITLNGTPIGGFESLIILDTTPTDVSLSPSTVLVAVDQTHTVTATVTDLFGDPVPDGTTVTFTVSGVTQTSGTGTTTNGQATFSYSSPLPGSDQITATVDAGDNPSASATVNWSLPDSTPGARINGRQTTNGIMFIINAYTTMRGAPDGFLTYMSSEATLTNVRYDRIVVDGRTGTVFGTARVANQNVSFRLDVAQGQPNTLRLRLSTGYDSGEIPVSFLQISTLRF